MGSEPAPKLGLALSGGGHRAAFFHIGVLGALAELGLLRKVRVLSTVSGGSCVGALYYLHVKRLLEETDDGEISDSSYVEIVEKVACEYRDAAAKNLLARAYLNPLKNLKMALPWYSRTDRAGELLERHFYRQAWNGELVDGRIRMQDLCICPGGGSIDPDSDENAKRNGPVPILLLEATSLNTGHNWRFEAKYMGEPPRQTDSAVVTDVDKNVLLERTPWPALPEALRDFPLGLAVASSAAFPGGFTPVQIRNLYPGYVVELTDGGVHDNQGVEGLVDRGCTHVILSDGSGQMQDVPKPGTWIPAVLERVVSVYGDAEREQRLLRAFAEVQWEFFHLQSGLPNATRAPQEPVVETPSALTTLDFGVAEDVQRGLARVRTNLNAFSELEAWALAKDGHAIASRVARVEGDAGIRALAEPIEEEITWPWDGVDLLEPSSQLRWVLAHGGQQMLGLFLPLLALAAAAAVLGGWLLAPHGYVLFGITLGTLLAVALYLVRPNRVSAFIYESVMPALLALPMLLGCAGLWLAGRLWLRRGRVPRG